VNENEKDLMTTWATTAWTKVFAGGKEGDNALQARKDLLVRYHEAVYHYFLLKIRNPHDAGELYTNFALRLMETSDLVKNATPEKGRFRHYLKAALHHMVLDYHRRRTRDRKVQPLALDVAQHDVVSDQSGEAGGDFPPIWRQELLNQAWKALEKIEKKTGQLHYTVLRFQSDHPDLKAPQIADQLSAKMGKPFTHDGVRQTLHRAREKYAVLLLEEVERSMENPTMDDLEAELIDLQLLSFCKKALEKRRAVA
jgi:RNA polymerase sigma-70 factor (ECF subfamily)